LLIAENPSGTSGAAGIYGYNAAGNFYDKADGSGFDISVLEGPTDCQWVLRDPGGLVIDSAVDVFDKPFGGSCDECGPQDVSSWENGTVISPCPSESSTSLNKCPEVCVYDFTWSEADLTGTYVYNPDSDRWEQEGGSGYIQLQVDDPTPLIWGIYHPASANDNDLAFEGFGFTASTPRCPAFDPDAGDDGAWGDASALLASGAGGTASGTIRVEEGACQSSTSSTSSTSSAAPVALLTCGCGAEGGTLETTAPRMLIRMSWTGGPETRNWLNCTWNRGEEKEVCPNFYTCRGLPQTTYKPKETWRHTAGGTFKVTAFDYGYSPGYDLKLQALLSIVYGAKSLYIRHRENTFNAAAHSHQTTQAGFTAFPPASGLSPGFPLKDNVVSDALGFTDTQDTVAATNMGTATTDTGVTISWKRGISGTGSPILSFGGNTNDGVGWGC
jgi:hypothetical protein